MKKILVLLLGIVLIASFTVGFAYTPSQNLQNALEVAVDKLEGVVERRGESYRQKIISLLDGLLKKYEGNDKAQYAFGFLKDELFENISASSSTNSTLPSDYLGEYTISDSEYGTQTSVTLTDSSRIIKTNSLPNHTTGEFPNSGNPNTISAQDITYELPLNPTYTGDATWAREPGVAVNGVKLEPETAERVSCSSGEEYKIEAIQDLADLGLDFNNAHVQPTGAYHYHGYSQKLVDVVDTGEDLVHVAFALDGFKMYYSKSNTYKPSYTLSDETRTGTSCTYRNATVGINATSPNGTYVSDRLYVKGSGNLDSCNGTYINDEYVYFITDSYPYIPRCLNGEFTESRPGGRAPGGAGGPGQGGFSSQGGQHGHPHPFPPPRRH